MGKQELLEENYPKLITKAKQFIGFETFFELSSHPYGVPLSTLHPAYSKLIKKQKDLKKGIEAEFEKHKIVREANPNLPSVELKETENEDDDGEQQVVKSIKQ